MERSLDLKMEGNLMANKITLIGTITSKIEKSYRLYSCEDVYCFDLSTRRISGVADVLRCHIPIGIKPKELMQYDKVYIVGEIHTRNVRLTDEKTKVEVFVWVKEIDFANEYGEDLNEVEIDGFTCKENMWRKTPLGREICEFIVASNRSFGKTDYVPCISFGRLSKLVSEYERGTHLWAAGRMQSRIYGKRISESEIEERVAYEVCVNRMEVVKNEEN